MYDYKENSTIELEEIIIVGIKPRNVVMSLGYAFDPVVLNRVPYGEYNYEAYLESSEQNPGFRFVNAEGANVLLSSESYKTDLVVDSVNIKDTMFNIDLNKSNIEGYSKVKSKHSSFKSSIEALIEDLK